MLWNFLYQANKTPVTAVTNVCHFWHFLQFNMNNIKILQKFLILCYTEENKFETTWGWLNDNNGCIFIFKTFTVTGISCLSNCWRNGIYNWLHAMMHISAYTQGMQVTDAVSLLFTQAQVICHVSYFS